MKPSATSYPLPKPNPLAQWYPSSMFKHKLISWSLHMYLWLQVGREPHEQVVRRQQRLQMLFSVHVNALSQGREAAEGQMGLDGAGSQRGWTVNGQLREACRNSPLLHVGSLLSPPRSCITCSSDILGKEKPGDYPRDRRHGQDHSKSPSHAASWPGIQAQATSESLLPRCNFL